jgi:hypothetical protein
MHPRRVVELVREKFGILGERLGVARTASQCFRSELSVFRFRISTLVQLGKAAESCRTPQGGAGSKRTVILKASWSSLPFAFDSCGAEGLKAL